MLILFGTGPTVLGDDQNDRGTGRFTVELLQWGGKCMVQESPLAPNPAVPQAPPFLKPLGNVKGPFEFESTNSFGTIDLGAADFGTKYALIGTQGNLIIQTLNSKVFTYANSVCEGVMRVNGQGKSEGVKWVIRYLFRTGLMTIT